MLRFRSCAVGLALAVASIGALAQDKCASVPEGMRARCEEGMRVSQACAGLTGEALKTCQQKTVQFGAMREDCGSLAGEARARCEQNNRSVEAAKPCKGKSGPDLETCIKTEAAAAAQRGAPAK